MFTINLHVEFSDEVSGNSYSFNKTFNAVMSFDILHLKVLSLSASSLLRLTDQISSPT